MGNEDIKYPDWWPECPYPENIFTADIEDIARALPDDNLRTAISGAYGRIFWKIASRMIYEAMINHQTICSSRYHLLLVAAGEDHCDICKNPI
jgi:hypothetical protein